MFFLAKLDRAHYFKGLHVLDRGADDAAGGPARGRRRRRMARQQYESRRAPRSGDRARFLGDVPDELLPAYYRAADVVALPSTDRTEAFGLVLIEAMACGTPVVASRLPGVRTLVQEGATGYLVEPGDAIDLADKIRRCLDQGAAMRSTARAFVASRFSDRAVVSQLLELYQTLTSASPRRLSGTQDAAQRSVAML